MRTPLILLALLGFASLSAAQRVPDRSHEYRGIFETPVVRASIDTAPGVTGEWIDGAFRAPSGSPTDWALVFLASRDARTRHHHRLGLSQNPGTRYIRIGFTEPMPVGALYVATAGTVPSVLRPDAPYPGNPDDDAQWIPAEPSAHDPDAPRLLWQFPAGTTTRALRLRTEIPANAETGPDGLYGYHSPGVYLFAAPWHNLGPAASPHVQTGTRDAALLNDDRCTCWRMWSGGKPGVPLSPEHPQDVTLVWPARQTLRGIGLEHPFFTAADVYVCNAPDGIHPRNAPESAWMRVASLDELRTQYPESLAAVWADFGKTVQTRGLRLRILRPFHDPADTSDRDLVHPEHGHMRGKTKGGTVAGLDELLVLGPAPAITPAAHAQETPVGIPVRFTMPYDGYATLVVEDSAGRRVRNLVSTQPFPQGENTVWWDGCDDLGRDIEAARHGLYHVPARPVEPGTYRVRGLTHREIVPRYEFAVYNAGTPPWSTPDHTGGWLANHSAPSAAAFWPGEGDRPDQLILGAHVTEGPDGLITVDLNGRKTGGKRWIGGNWTSAAHVAVDTGAHRNPDILYYVAAVGTIDRKAGTHELRLTAIRAGDAKPDTIALPVPDGGPGPFPVGGIAAHDGTVAVSIGSADEVWLFGPGSREPRRLPVASPRGIAYAANGALHVLTGTSLARLNPTTGSLSPLPASGLEDPVGLAIAPDGTFYVSDAGDSHQVKVFGPDGAFRRAIGHAGRPRSGRYDPLHMNHPVGLAIDSRGRLWVAECDFLPKRVSVWSPADGRLIKAFYGPAKYGAGGVLDPEHPDRFYYAEEKRGLMEFELDWDAGESRLRSVLFRADADATSLASAHLPAVSSFNLPERPLPETLGRPRLFSNGFNSAPVNGARTVVLFARRGESLVPVAQAGSSLDAPGLAALAPDLPKDECFFLWSDRDGNGAASADEVQLRTGSPYGLMVQEDGAITACGVRPANGRTGEALRIPVRDWTRGGTPVYHLDDAETLAAATRPSPSSGGNQLLLDDEGRILYVHGVDPLPNYSVAGGRPGAPTWSIPNMWPGLHAGHSSPAPQGKGRLTAPTRLLGPFVRPQGSEVAPLCAINGNHGDIYLITADGLFVDAVFEDVRLGRPWRQPVATRDMDLRGITPGDEHFWPTMSRTPDGTVHLVVGKDVPCLVRLDGLDSLRPLSAGTVEVTEKDLLALRQAQERAEAVRRAREGIETLRVSITAAAPTVDGSLSDWDGADWAPIEERGAHAYFNSDSKPFDIRAALRVSGDFLYAAWRTGDRRFADNRGDNPAALFKTGGGLDLMLSTKPRPSPRGADAGDLRILAAMVGGKPRVMLYEAVVPGTRAEDRVPFSSPHRTIWFDRVRDITDRCEFAGNAGGNFELRVPLSLLGLSPKKGTRLRGDLGVLRGESGETIARRYWSNKATGIVSDVPSEAQLLPANWGVLLFE